MAKIIEKTKLGVMGSASGPLLEVPEYLEKAYEFAPIIYSLHLNQTIPFITKLIKALNGSITYKKTYKFPIKHQFTFHTKPVKYFDVTLLRCIKL